MRKGLIGFIAICFFLCIFFRGGTEVDEQAYVISLGIDIAGEDKLLVTMELPSISNANPETGSTPSEQKARDKYQVLEAEAYTIIDAVEALRTLVPDNFNFTQTLQIIASEAFARSDQFIQALDNLMLLNDIRQSSALIISRDSANEYIRAQRPFLGIRLSEDINTGLKVFSEMGYIPPSILGKALYQMKAGWQDTLLPLAAINNASQLNTDTGRDMLAGRILDTIAGEIQNSGDKQTDLLGAAVFRRGRMVGTLTGFEMQLLSYLSGDMNQFVYYLNGSYYKMVNLLPARLKMIPNGDQWVLQVKGGIRVNPLRGEEVDVEQLTNAFNNDILQVIWKLQTLGADPMGFQGKAVHSVATLTEWQAIDWMKIYQNATVEVQTNASIGMEN